MGIQLVEEVMDYAARIRLTTGERWGLAVLARDANDQSRLTYHHANDPEILRRVGIAPDAWCNVRAALVRKRVLEVTVPGKRGRAAMYRIAELAHITHPADREPSRMVHPSDGVSREMVHPSGGVSREMVHPSGGESALMVHPSDGESKIAPISSSSVPPPPGAGPLPSARQGERERPMEEEELAPSYRQAYALLEGLDEVAVHRDANGVMGLAAKVASRLRAGWAPGRLRERLNGPAPVPMFSAVAVLNGRIDQVPTDPRQDRGGTRPADVSVAEVKGGAFARTGERPGAVDVSTTPGGWREIMRQRQERS